MVATEAVEFGGLSEEEHLEELKRGTGVPQNESAQTYPPPIRYGLELVRQADGSYKWTE